MDEKVPKELMDTRFQLFAARSFLVSLVNSIGPRASLMDFRVVKYLGVMTPNCRNLVNMTSSRNGLSKNLSI